MPVPRRSLQIFSMSFLDVLSCGLGAILLISILVSTFAQRSATALLRQRYVILTASVEVDAPSEGEGLAQLELLLPDSPDASLPDGPLSTVRGMAAYPVPRGRIPTHRVQELSARAPARFIYCMLRGVQARGCILRLTLASLPPDWQTVRISGWLADPVHGQRALTEVVRASIDPELLEYGGFTLPGADTAGLILRRSGAVAPAAAQLLLRADLPAED